MNIGADGVVLIQGLKATIRDLEAEVARLHQALRDIALLSQKVTGDDKKQLTPQDDNDTVLT